MLAIPPYDPELSSSQNNVLKLKKTATSQPVNEQLVRLEIKASTLADLFAGQQICAADFHCQDHASKLLVQKLCLENCLKQDRSSCTQIQEETISYLSSLIAS